MRERIVKGRDRFFFLPDTLYSRLSSPDTQLADTCRKLMEGRRELEEKLEEAISNRTELAADLESRGEEFAAAQVQAFLIRQGIGGMMECVCVFVFSP